MSSLIPTAETPTGIKTVKTTCAYCGVGCGIEAKVNPHAREVTVFGDDLHQANYGRLCSKGSSLGETIGVSSRLLYPEIRGERASWDEALDAVADGFKKVIEEHGPDAVAFYGSGQLLTEDYYVANKLMKGFIGSGNMDTNSRLCMSSAVTAHKRTFGTDTVPNCYDDLELAKLIVIVGSNTAWCHPIIFQRIRNAKDRNPDMKVVVIDPRRTATCDIADLHLPIASGSDVKIWNGLLSFLSGENILDQAFIDDHCEGFDEALIAALSDAGDVQSVADYCQISASDLHTFYHWFAETQASLTLYSQGIKQSSSGVDKVNAIVNVHLSTGRIGKPGCGPLSLTGQPNAMGGREVGGLANQLAAHMMYDEDARERVATFWQTDNVASKPGLTAVNLFDAVAEGKIKAIWIMATNPVVSMPNADQVKAALQKCDLVVASDCVAKTDTLNLAHIKLPALGWSEKDGMVTNSERRISRQRALLPPAGESKPDWWILSRVGQRMGFHHAFDYQHAVDIFREHAALSGYENNPMQSLRAFDISGLADISRKEYDAFEPTQWPINKAYPKGKKRFFGNGFFYTPNAKAKIVAITSRKPGHAVDKSFPLVLNTGRLRDQWHTMTRSALSPRLNQHRPEPFVEVHPEDAKRYELEEGGLAHLQSHWGQMYTRVSVTDSQKPGNVFVPMHWTEQYAKRGRMGALVNPVTDPLSNQPESKHTPVRVRPLNASWYGFILSREPLQDLNVEYQVTVVADGYYRYELAGVAMPKKFSECVHQFLQIGIDDERQEYEDSASGLYRFATFRSGKIQSFFMASGTYGTPSLPSRIWLGSVFAKERFEAHERAAVLAGVPTAGVEDIGAIVCSCFSVGEKTILKAIKDKQLTTFQAVGACCKAGTNCGSCIPEIKALISG